jgi:hypothetical protein
MDIGSIYTLPQRPSCLVANNQRGGDATPPPGRPGRPLSWRRPSCTAL